MDVAAIKANSKKKGRSGGGSGPSKKKKRRGDDEEVDRAYSSVSFFSVVLFN